MQENFGELKHEVAPGAVEAEKEQVEQNTTPEQAPEQTLETSVNVEAAAPALEVESTPETTAPIEPAVQTEVDEFVQERPKEPDFSPQEQRLDETLRRGGYQVGVREQLPTDPTSGGAWLRTAREWLMRKVNAIMGRE